MAVYTDVGEEMLRHFLQSYELGELQSFHGIAEGIENSNFRLVTDKGTFILTLFERRMDPQELPWFLGFMGHLAREGISCPLPIAGRDGNALRSLAGRPAVIVTFLPGTSLDQPDQHACEELGRMMARLHVSGKGYVPVRRNALDPQGWKALLARCSSGGEPRVEVLISEAHQALQRLMAQWPESDMLPRGQIHADLFPDNVFFQDGRLSGVIDFYFACTDFLAYDIAICLNAWCFENEEQYRPEWAQALLSGYESVRQLTVQEREALPLLCQGAALRFLLTRLYDWVHTPEDALVTRKDPWAYQRRLAFFMGRNDV
ncbi:homoserine kinase [Saccharibacter sp. 17.LH.SD]|uniref:homoserine kinase n=1 Tax=Saccharibacter sp. 17.LH.SD TaxID=2689393 RepID=UPI00137162AA|nr:homoserine kinase [Saccharibacter sp. 17.LH.SD]MXV44712.1 homoserine kinase [Saccharibacter sp. 17.LH.SD]